jgi:hypothetical protein
MGEIEIPSNKASSIRQPVSEVVWKVMRSKSDEEKGRKNK